MEYTDGIVSFTRILEPGQFGFAESKLLYSHAFTADERREPAEINLLLGSEVFHYYLITHYGQPAGLVALWKFDTFVYVEHFAVSEQLRNKKIGERAMKLLCNNMEKPLILEAELPTNEFALRRLGFYKRQGFNILSEDYLQPAYGAAKQPVKMLLLGNHLFSDEETSAIISLIKTKVFNLQA